MFDLTSLSFDTIRHWFTSPFLLLAGLFQLWMLIHALLHKEWFWALFILIFPLFGTFWYFFQMYRGSSGGMRGFELPGAHDRRRIKALQAQIHNLDKAHHHQQLGDIYFQQGKLAKAEACYRAAIEREPDDIDSRAHLGQCLLRQKRAAEARPLLEGVCAQDPKHDYGHSLMALAETLTALGEKDSAIGVWQQVTASHSYARARVQLAELLRDKGRPDEARALLQEVINDAPHGPAFDRKRERIWVAQARRSLSQLG